MTYKSIRKLLFFSFFAFLVWISSLANDYNIRVSINGIQDSSVILAHYVNKSMYPDDTAYVDLNGEAVFSGEGTLAEGMYLIYLPSGKYFDIMMGESQNFSIKTDTANFITHTKISNSPDNEIFFNFQSYMIEKHAELKAFQETLKNTDDDKEKEKAKEEIKKLDQERKNKINQIVSKNPDLFVSVFLKATLEIEVPDPPVNEDGSIDSTWKYNYYRHHYFDNFDPSDVRLLHTPLYEDKIMQYLEKVIPQIPDTINKEIDYLVEKFQSDSAIFRYMLITLFKYYGNSNIMGMDAVQVHIAENYYIPEAWWSAEKYITELEERVEIMKPILIGKIAPDFELLAVPKEHFISAANDSALKRYPHAGTFFRIHDVNSDFLVLFFWEADCSHCKKAVPKLYKQYKDTLENMGVRVLAISTMFGEDGKEKWIDFINKHQLYDWVNAWYPYDYKFKIAYDVRTTPQIFILDKNKKIIAKRIGVEQVAELISVYRKQFLN
jgi:alkyl hydroperoxide reductase subunit AhpC